MAINVSVQYNGGLLPDMILLTQCYYHRGTRLGGIIGCKDKTSTCTLDTVQGTAVCTLLQKIQRRVMGKIGYDRVEPP